MDVPDSLVLESPDAARALMHPVRQFAATELYATQTPQTATELAELCGGISASSMSYHLRELERLGLITRTTPLDGRERPWLAAARSYTVQTAGELDEADRGALIDAYLEPVRARMRGHLARRSRLEPADQDTIFNILTTGQLYLDEARTRALTEELTALFRRYEGYAWDESGAEPAADDTARPIRSHYLWSVVPDVPADFNRGPDESAATPD